MRSAVGSNRTQLKEENYLIQTRLKMLLYFSKGKKCCCKILGQ